MRISRSALGLAAWVLAACGSVPTGGGGRGGQCPDPNDPNVHYASQNPDSCEHVDLSCNDQHYAFSDECGCGCIDPVNPSPCPDPNEPRATYASTDPEACKVIDFACAEGEITFGGACGCGCIGRDPACPDPDDPKVHYISPNPGYCESADLDGCPPGQALFWQMGVGDQCGCGCIDTSCFGLEQAACAASLVCMPTYTQFCDCGCENGLPGCAECPPDCWAYAGCAFTGE